MAKSKRKTPVVPPVPVEEKQKNTFIQRADEWLGKRQKQFITVLLTIAVVLRIVYFIQLNSGPCIWQHSYKESDMHFYDEWAKIIERGNWLSDLSFHQYDAPQQWIADYYFKIHPDEAIELQKQLGTDKSPEALGKLLWSRWDGGKIYHQDPLYIYIIAVVYKIFGEDVRFVFILQMIIGVFSVLFIYLITRTYFGYSAAFSAGLLAVFCGPLLFYELTLVRESIIVFAGLILVFVMNKALEKGSVKHFFILGITIAICVLLKSTFMLFLFFAIVNSFIIYRNQLRLFLRYSAMLLAGALLAYSPLLIRNSIVGVPLISQNSVGAIAAIASNDVSYKPEESYEINLKNATEILSKTSGKMFPAFIYSLQTHPDAFSYFKLLFRKLMLVFHWYEFPNNKNFYYYRLHAPVLWFTFVNLLVIAPLAISGFIVSIIQRKNTGPLTVLLLMHLLLLVVFLVLSRYRIPFEAALIPFAGFAIAETITFIQLKLKYGLIMSAGIIAATVWVGRPLPQSITLIRGVDYQQPYNFYYKQIIENYMNTGEMKKALNTMNDFMKFEPDDVKKLNSQSGSLNSYEIILAKVYATFHAVYSNLYQRAGDDQKSQAEKNRSEVLQQLVVMNDRSGSMESLLLKASAAPPGVKEKMYQELVAPLWNQIKINPNNTKPYRDLNDIYQYLNLPDSSIFVLQELLKLNENDFYTLFQLGTVYGKFKNDFRNAAVWLEKAKEIDSKSEDVYLNLGIVYSILLQNDKALEMMRKAEAINPNNQSNLKNMELLLRKSGKNEEADEIKKRLQ